jgi:putative transposase
VNVYPFIEVEKRQQRNVKRACELLKVSRAAYYAYRDQTPSAHAAGDAQLLEQVTAVHEKSKGRYGAPRIHVGPRDKGEATPARHRVDDVAALQLHRRHRAAGHRRCGVRGGVPAGPSYVRQQDRGELGRHPVGTSAREADADGG